MSEKKKLTKRQIVKMIFSILGVVMVLISAVVAMFYKSLPPALSFLPFPFLIGGLAILLIMKTTGKPFIELLPPPPPSEPEEKREDAENIDAQKETDADASAGQEPEKQEEEPNQKTSEK